MASPTTVVTFQHVSNVCVFQIKAFYWREIGCGRTKGEESTISRHRSGADAFIPMDSLAAYTHDTLPVTTCGRQDKAR
jgi:hypothetical protein